MLAKPSKLARDVAKYDRRQQRAKLKAATDRKAMRDWLVVRDAVWTRDAGMCRACAARVVRAGHPLYIGHVHHIVYRSAMGADTTQNCLLLCARCHDDVHLHRLDITGDGDGDGEIVVTRRDA